jgi:hypothetical protein
VPEFTGIKTINLRNDKYFEIPLDKQRASRSMENDFIDLKMLDECRSICFFVKPVSEFLD